MLLHRGVISSSAPQINSVGVRNRCTIWIIDFATREGEHRARHNKIHHTGRCKESNDCR